MIRLNCACSISASGHEEVEHGTALFPAACYQDNLTEMPVPWHWHDELEIAVITEGTASFATDQERLKKMLSYIRVHFSEEVSVREIAAAAAVSESECIRCFRNSIGATPIRYAKQLRLQEAAQLLVSTDKKIVEIENECGFREMNYFARSFREQFGMTPTEYRRQKSQR